MRATLQGALIALLAVAGPGQATEVYRWTDEAGRVHYGDRRAGPGAEKMEVTPNAPQGPDPARRATTRRLLEAFESRRDRARKARAEQHQREQQRSHRCTAARRQLQIIERAGPLYRKDDSGGRIYLTDDQRAASRNRAERAVGQWCD